MKECGQFQRSVLNLQELSKDVDTIIIDHKRSVPLAKKDGLDSVETPWGFLFRGDGPRFLCCDCFRWVRVHGFFSPSSCGDKVILQSSNWSSLINTL